MKKIFTIITAIFMILSVSAESKIMKYNGKTFITLTESQDKTIVDVEKLRQEILAKDKSFSFYPYGGNYYRSNEVKMWKGYEYYKPLIEEMIEFLDLTGLGYVQYVNPMRSDYIIFTVYKTADNYLVEVNDYSYDENALKSEIGTEVKTGRKSDGKCVRIMHIDFDEFIEGIESRTLGKMNRENAFKDEYLKKIENGFYEIIVGDFWTQRTYSTLEEAEKDFIIYTK